MIGLLLGSDTYFPKFDQQLSYLVRRRGILTKARLNKLRYVRIIKISFRAKSTALGGQIHMNKEI